MLIQTSIENKIKESLNPVFYSVVNESHLHHVPKNSETHFKIEIVSSIFEQKKLLERHRLVQEILAEEISKIKACALHTLTPAEWEINKNEKFVSPKCVGGSKP